MLENALEGEYKGTLMLSKLMCFLFLPLSVTSLEISAACAAPILNELKLVAGLSSSVCQSLSLAEAAFGVQLLFPICFWPRSHIEHIKWSVLLGSRWIYKSTTVSLCNTMSLYTFSIACFAGVDHTPLRHPNIQVSQQSQFSTKNELKCKRIENRFQALYEVGENCWGASWWRRHMP